MWFAFTVLLAPREHHIGVDVVPSRNDGHRHAGFQCLADRLLLES
jgi:hypothetical protein